MQLTREQEEIIQCDLGPGQSLKVLAFAGTGKTTVLEAYTRARPHLKFLYLAFNKSVQTEAARRFPSNVQAMTSHGLAFRTKGYPHKDRLVPGFKAGQVMAALDLDQYEDARFTIETLTAYLASADPKVSARHIPGAARAYYQEKKIPLPDLVALANALGRLMCIGETPDIGMLHDGYLKLYQLSGPILDADCILLDEAQDINPVTADIVFSQIRCQTPPHRPLPSLILVGDLHQQIYSFRGAGQSLARFSPTHTRYLTQSFRFDANVARAANMVLATFKKETHPLRGTPLPRKKPWDKSCHTIIARTNAALFARAVSLIKTHKTGFCGGVLAARLDRLKDVSYLKENQRGKIRDPFVRGFLSYRELFSYARAVEDMEILAQCGMAETYGPMLPALVDRVMDQVVDESEAQILLTTAHRAKGREWPCVLLLDDFTPLVKEGRPVDPASADPDEFNLVYVAMTRAMTHLRFARGSDIPAFIRSCLKKE